PTAAAGSSSPRGAGGTVATPTFAGATLPGRAPFPTGRACGLSVPPITPLVAQRPVRRTSSPSTPVEESRSPTTLHSATRYSATRFTTTGDSGSTSTTTASPPTTPWQPWIETPDQMGRRPSHNGRPP